MTNVISGVNTLLRFNPARVSDVTMQRNMDNVSQSIDSILQVPWLNGVLLEDITLDPDGRNDIAHGLGKNYRGWMVASLKHTPTAFRAYLASNTSTTTGSTLVCDTEDYDYAGAYDTSTGAYTAPAAGFYQFEVSTWWDDMADGNFVYIDFRVNGSTVRYSDIDFTGAGPSDVLRHDHFVIRLDKGDVVSAAVFQGFGAARTLFGGTDNTYFSGGLESTPMPYEAPDTEDVDRFLYLPLYSSGSPTVSLWVF